MRETFTADFGNGLQCTMVFDKKPGRKEVSILPVEWSRKPGSKEELASIAAAYRAWSNSVRETLATKWDIKMMCALNVEKDRTEIWVYAPNTPAKLDKVLPYNIPPA